MKVLVFGSNSDIGKAIITEIESLGYISVIQAPRSIVDFTDIKSDDHVKALLDSTSPDIIINSVGVFDDNYATHHNTMNVNFGSCWSIVKYYVNKKEKNTKIILIGSSAYKQGKKDYMLYSASKAALYNLWEGATAFFNGTNVSVNLINPVRVNTKMIKSVLGPNMDYLEPIDVANEVVKLITSDQNNICIDMTYKDKK